MTEATASARATQEEKGTGPMEFSVKKFDLLEELNLTQGVVERKTTIPILSNILCEAKGNRLTITATDLELSIRTSCEAKVKKEGAGTIPAKKLLELVRLLPDEEIKFKLLENHWVQITCDRKNYKLVGMSKENFPALPAFPHALVKIPAKLLADVIAKTTFAISLEESRYTLNGALLVLKPGSLTMVATDGHRLAMVETDHKFEGFTTETRVLVPKKAMTEDPAPRRRIGRRSPARICPGRKPSFLPVWPPPAHLAQAHRPVPELRSRPAARRQQNRRDRAQ